MVIIAYHGYAVLATDTESVYVAKQAIGSQLKAG